MSWNQLSKESQDYINRYIRTSSKTREEALQEKVVQEVVYEYEHGSKNRLIFI